MGKRIVIGETVPELVLELADGKEYRWRASLATLRQISLESDSGVFAYLTDLAVRYEKDLIGTVGEVLHFGLHWQYPELTPDAILDMFPPSIDLLIELANALADLLAMLSQPSDEANPTMPGTAT